MGTGAMALSPLVDMAVESGESCRQDRPGDRQTKTKILASPIPDSLKEEEGIAVCDLI